LEKQEKKENQEYRKARKPWKIPETRRTGNIAHAFLEA